MAEPAFTSISTIAISRHFPLGNPCKAHYYPPSLFQPLTPIASHWVAHHKGSSAVGVGHSGSGRNGEPIAWFSGHQLLAVWGCLCPPNILNWRFERQNCSLKFEVGIPPQSACLLSIYGHIQHQGYAFRMMGNLWLFLNG